MKMITLLFIAAATILTMSLSAQDRNRQFSAEDMAKRQTESLKKELNLTAEQETKVKEVYLKYAKKQEERMKARQGQNRQSMSEEERTKAREEMEKSNKERDTELKAVVTAEQYTKYEKWRDGQTNRRGQGRRP